MRCPGRTLDASAEDRLEYVVEDDRHDGARGDSDDPGEHDPPDDAEVDGSDSPSHPDPEDGSDCYGARFVGLSGDEQQALKRFVWAEG